MNKFLKNYNGNSKILKIVILILVGIYVLYLFLRKFSEVTGSICLIRGIIGIPCPSCGITRAVISFINGNIINAFKFHPLFWLPFVVAVLIIFKREFFKKILVIAIISITIIYILRMVLLFPNVEPMKYNERAIFSKWQVNK